MYILEPSPPSFFYLVFTRPLVMFLNIEKIVKDMDRMPWLRSDAISTAFVSLCNVLVMLNPWSSLFSLNHQDDRLAYFPKVFFAAAFFYSCVCPGKSNEVLLYLDIRDTFYRCQVIWEKDEFFLSKKIITTIQSTSLKDFINCNVSCRVFLTLFRKFLLKSISWYPIVYRDD